MRTLRFALIGLAALGFASAAMAQDHPNIAGEVAVVTGLPDSADVAAWKARLNEEINELIDAGHMAPLRVQPGETESNFYFTDPFEQTLTLSLARPYMTDKTAAKAKAFLARELAAYHPAWVSLLPPFEGKFRENYDLPANERDYRWRRWLWRSVNQRPRMMTFYALWAHAEAFDGWDWVEKNYADLTMLYYQEMARKPNLVEEAGGLIGFARIARRVGDIKRAESAEQTAEGILSAATDFAAQMQIARDRHDGDMKNQGGRALNRAIVHPLFNLVPETARFLAAHDRDAVKTALDRMMARYALWYIPLPPNSEPLFGEGTSLGPDNKAVIFLGRAMILGDSARQLKRDLDIPWVPVGDLYYMRYLTTILNAAGKTEWKAYATKTPETSLYDEADIRKLAAAVRAQKSMPWQLSKAFPSAGDAGFAKVLPPETGAVPGGDGASEMGYKSIKLRGGSIDLQEFFEGAAGPALAYTVTFVSVPAETEAMITVRNDDALAVWVNGKEVLRDAEGLGWMPGQRHARFTLNKGVNTVLVKLQQREGAWPFEATITKADGSLLLDAEFSAEPGK